MGPCLVPKATFNIRVVEVETRKSGTNVDRPLITKSGRNEKDPKNFKLPTKEDKKVYRRVVMEVQRVENSPPLNRSTGK